MDTLIFFLVPLALGSANPIGPTTIFGPTQDDRIRNAIDNNVQWLLSGIRNGNLKGPDLSKAVVALFLAKPEFFSPGHEIGQELRDKIETHFTELIRKGEILAEDPRTPKIEDNFVDMRKVPSFIPSEELAPYLQALLVSCVDPFDFRGYDLPRELYGSIRRYHCERGCTFPSSFILALCNARATAVEDYIFFFSNTVLFQDEEYFLPMTFGCLESSNHPYLRHLDPKKINPPQPFQSSGYRHYPSNLRAEDLQEMLKPDPVGNITSVSAIAAAMQNLMYNHHLRVSDLPSAVDFLLKSQDEDGSWGQSTLNSFFVLPVLSNTNFLDITSDHCPAESGNGVETSENKTLVAKGGVSISVLGDSLDIRWSFATSLYGELSTRAWYHEGTDGKPYLTSLQGNFKYYENNPETGYFWFTYEQTKWPKESFTLLTQSHADIQLKRTSRYLLWYRKISEVETQNDENETEAVPQMES